MTDQKPPADKFVDLPEDTRVFISRLRPDEIETLKALVQLRQTDLQAIVANARWWAAAGVISKSVTWACGVIFVAAGTAWGFVELVLKAVGTFKGGR